MSKKELPVKGTRNYDIEYLEYLKNRVCFLKLKYKSDPLIIEIIA